MTGGRAEEVVCVYEREKGKKQSFEGAFSSFGRLAPAPEAPGVAGLCWLGRPLRGGWRPLQFGHCN